VEPDVRDLVEPAIELALEVLGIGEASSGDERGLQVAVQPLHHALALGICCGTKVHPEPEVAGEAGKRLGRTRIARRLVGAQRPFSVEHVGARDAEPTQAPVHRPQQVGGRLGEHQRAGAHLRVAKDTGQNVAPSEVAVADRDPNGGLPQVPLTDAARQVKGALVDPRLSEQRPDLGKVLVQDGLAALVPQA
jgi:hypothetical protein